LGAEIIPLCKKPHYEILHKTLTGSFMELPKKEKDMRSESWNVTSLYMVNLFKSIETDVEKYNVGFIGSTEKGRGSVAHSV
jgi:hypothetical protein